MQGKTGGTISSPKTQRRCTVVIRMLSDLMGLEKLKLGETEVGRIGLGTNRLTNTREHVAFVKDAVAAGVDLIDSAYTYAGGESEETIGAALSSIPEDCVVATKGRWKGARPEVLRGEMDE